MKISICIPTFNRARHLANCLRSIATNDGRAEVDFEVCVSDNCSTDETGQVVQRAQESLQIKYCRNPTNLGIPRNFLNVVQMAEGEFVWLLGDDDLLMPYALKELSELIAQNPAADFFYVNSFHLTTEYVFSFPQPFESVRLPAGMTPFSSWTGSGALQFLELIDPRVSFDFLGGMFLSVFRRLHWTANVAALDAAAVADPRTFSHFDNTFPHVKIFARAFANSQAFFAPRPLSVCLTGAREWAPMYPFVKSVRLIEALHEYRRSGLPYARYWRCKNFALSNAIPDLVAMSLRRDRSGFAYLRPGLLVTYLAYPNFYLSLPRFLLRKSALLLARLGAAAHRNDAPAASGR